jgi:hypothetical protein
MGAGGTLPLELSALSLSGAELLQVMEDRHRHASLEERVGSRIQGRRRLTEGQTSSSGGRAVGSDQPRTVPATALGGQ